MNHALLHNQAVSGAPGRRLAQVVRFGVVACVLAVTGASALAQDRNPRRDEEQQARERYQLQAQQAQQDVRYDQRVNELRDEQRRQMEQEAQMRSEARRRDGRMTPDERRDLRRQINEAGVDLYPNARRR